MDAAAEWDFGGPPPVQPTSGVVGADGLSLVGSNGASLETVAGALSPGVSVDLAPAETPTLPDGVTALGNAVQITTSEVPGAPATVRLPLPPGAPRDGLIYRISDSGRVTALATTVEGEEAVATTPGFSTFVYGFPDSIAGELRNTLTINGSTFLPVGTSLPYSVRGFFVGDPARLQYFWQTWGDGAVLAGAAGTAATLRGVTADAGLTTLGVEVFDPKDGLRMFTSVDVTVIEERSLAVELQATKTSALRAELVGFDALISGGTPPFTLTWQYGDGADGRAEAAPTSLPPSDGSAPPPLLFTAVPNHGWQNLGFFTVTIQVTDADGTQAAHAVAIEIRPDPLAIALDGPDIIMLVAGVESGAEYAALIDGGATPLRVSWDVTDGAVQGGQASFGLTSGGGIHRHRYGHDHGARLHRPPRRRHGRLRQRRRHRPAHPGRGGRIRYPGAHHPGGHHGHRRPALPRTRRMAHRR